MSWCKFSPGLQTVTVDFGEDVNNGWTGLVVTMDRDAVLKDATLCSDQCCKAIPNLFVLDVFDLLNWTKDTWNQQMDGQTTVTHYPMSFDYILFNTVLELLAILSPYFSLFFFPHVSLVKSGAGAVTSFCCQPLKHTGWWVHPVTLYIVTW